MIGGDDVNNPYSVAKNSEVPHNARQGSLTCLSTPIFMELRGTVKDTVYHLPHSAESKPRLANKTAVFSVYIALYAMSSVYK